MAKKTFIRVVLCHTDDFGDKNDKIRKWVEYHGGRVEKDITPEVTHLVASAKAWNHGSKLVKRAKKQPSVKVVTFDWLEDSLQSKAASPKKADPYLWSNVVAKSRQKNLDEMCAKAERVKAKLLHFDRECDELVCDLSTEGYHLYSDPTCFTYSITLARPIILMNRIERYHIKVRHHSTPNPIPLPLLYLSPSQLRPIILLPQECLTPNPSHSYPIRVPIVRPLAQQIQMIESHALPHTYGLFIRYSTLDKGVGTDLLCPLGSSFEFVFEQFRWFFKKKTGVAWESRLDELRGPEVMDDGRPAYEIDERTGEKESLWFRYARPKDERSGGRGLVVASTTAEDRERERARQSQLGVITMVVPTIEVSSSGGNVTPQARTPEGGW